MITFIDLFAGIGGFRLAFERAGATCVFASEWDKFACRTYEANFGDKPAGDITKISTDDIPDHDILTAGFPCQPFSIAGVPIYNSMGREHGFAHPTQGMLFFEIVRILKHKRPRAFLLENVKNLLHHNNGETFRSIYQTLTEDLGYVVTYKVIDARLLVPQHRERVFIVGYSEPFTFPTIPNFAPKLRDILEPVVDEKYTLSDRTWQGLQQRAQRNKAKGNNFRYTIANLDSYTRTLVAHYAAGGSEILIPQEGKNPRRLTPRECARLMGFPDSFKIVCSDYQAYRQFGNSVVVPVVEYIARALVRLLDT